MADNRRYYDYNYIEDGNTVRKLAPEYEPQPKRQRQEPLRDPAREAEIRKKRAKHNVIDFKYSLVISCVCVVVLASCIGYIREQANINAHKTSIAALQSELDRINNENVAKEEALNSSVDLDAIYQRASKKLGMKYADSNHTILYESSNPDYVRQYQDIPDNK